MLIVPEWLKISTSNFTTLLPGKVLTSLLKKKSRKGGVARATENAELDIARPSKL